MIKERNNTPFPIFAIATSLNRFVACPRKRKKTSKFPMNEFIRTAVKISLLGISNNHKQEINKQMITTSSRIMNLNATGISKTSSLMFFPAHLTKIPSRNPI